MHDGIPYDRIRVLFLDLGNTLISIDFERVSTALAARGFGFGPSLIRRAEAAARPTISAWLRRSPTGATGDSTETYLSLILREFPDGAFSGEEEIARLVTDLVPELFRDKDRPLWSYVLPGVPEALERFQTLGLRMTVVSNSDGSAEKLIARPGLRSYFTAVIDSHVVGVAKPNPEIFRLALEASNADPREVLHVGDIFDIDVVGARSAGLHALLLDPYFDWPHVDCERVPDLVALADRMSVSRR
jgi:HAD superfamily hydrolase (TIGR01509 family)